MNTALAVLGALGGFVAFGAAVVAIIRSIARQVAATNDNTRALEQFSEKVDNIDGVLHEHGERIARLEGSH